MLTIGLLTSNLYDAIPDYYRAIVVRLLNLASDEALRQYCRIVTTHGGIVYQRGDHFIYMVTEIQHRMISQLQKLFGEVPLTTFYTLNQERFTMLLQAEKIHKSCFGLQVKHCNKVFTLLPLNTYYLMYRPSIIQSVNNKLQLQQHFKWIPNQAQFPARSTRSNKTF